MAQFKKMFRGGGGGGLACPRTPLANMQISNIQIQISKYQKYIHVYGNTCTLFTKGREKDMRKNNTI